MPNEAKILSVDELNTHYYAGAASFRAGETEPKPAERLNRKAFEFRRGYIMARKHSRFAATIAARKE